MNPLKSVRATITIGFVLSLVIAFLINNDGAVLEQGTHPQLLKLGGIYAGLFRNQELMREMEIIL